MRPDNTKKAGSSFKSVSSSQQADGVRELGEVPGDVRRVVRSYRGDDAQPRGEGRGDGALVLRPRQHPLRRPHVPQPDLPPPDPAHRSVLRCFVCLSVCWLYVRGRRQESLWRTYNNKLLALYKGDYPRGK